MLRPFDMLVYILIMMARFARMQEKTVVESSSRATFSCLSKAHRLSKSCPVYVKSLIFKAYVLPVMCYSCACIPYSEKL